MDQKEKPAPGEGAGRFPFLDLDWRVKPTSRNFKPKPLGFVPWRMRLRRLERRLHEEDRVRGSRVKSGDPR